LARFFFADLDSVSAVGGLEMTGAAIVGGGGGKQRGGVVMHGIGGLRGRLLLKGNNGMRQAIQKESSASLVNVRRWFERSWW
jgi:hypothetical protein